MPNDHTRFAVSPCLMLLVAFILVRATVEGRPATFLLDPGAERSCLDAGLAARLRLRLARVESIRQPYAMSARVHCCLVPRRFFVDELSCVAFCGGATESLRCSNVSRTICFAGLVSPSLRSTKICAAVVPSW